MTNGTESKLDELVNEYKQPNKQPEVNEADKRVAEAVEWAEQKKREDELKAIKEQQEKEMAHAVSFVKKDAKLKHSDIVVRGVISALAEGDEVFNKAYAEKDKNPEGYEKALVYLGQKAKEELKVDSSASTVVRANIAADGYSDEEPDKPRNGKTDAEILAMSPSEFRAYKRSMGVA